MSLETVFALVGGWLMLGEKVTLQGSAGGFLMLSAMIISATGQYRRRGGKGL
jgi:drug/metabolite transporter (DMT)-like permease